MLMRLLEVLIALMFIYLVMAVLVSGINEWLAAKLGRRGQYLRLGLLRLIPDEAIYRRLLHHPLVESLYRERVAKGKMPSYIPPSDFSAALLDVVCTRAAIISQKPRDQNAPLTAADVRSAVLTLQGHGSPLAKSLLPILDRAQNDLAKVTEGVERWFNGGMDRVSGWYKSYAVAQLFVVSLAASVLANVDTIELARALWRSPQTAAQLAEQARQTVEAGKPPATKPTEKEIEQAHETLLKMEAAGLPLGFSCFSQSTLESDALAVVRACWQKTRSQPMGDLMLKIIGWLMTALAVSLGAPFWFDLLSRVVNVRASGPKPQTREATKG